MLRRLVPAVAIAAALVAPTVPAHSTDAPAAAPVGGAAQWEVRDGGVARVTRAGRIARALAEVHRSGDPRRTAAALHALERAELTGAVTPPRADAFLELMTVEAVGDLDGDGRDDIVETVVSYDDRTTTRVRARRGRDGGELWRVDVIGDAWVFGARLGATAAPGVVVVSEDGRDLPDNPAAFGAAGVRTIAGYAGSTGALQWTHAFAFSYSYGEETLTGLTPPLLRGRWDSLSGKADDLLFVAREWGGTYDDEGEVAHAYVVDGATGVLRAVPGAQAGLGESGEIAPVADLSGDGLGDLVVVDEQAGGAGRVTAYRADGVLLWSKDALATGGVGDVTSLGDVGGSAEADVAVSEWGSRKVAILSGADGSVLWRFDGDYATPLGDLNRDGKPEIATVAVDGSFGLIDFVVGDRAEKASLTLRAFGNGRGLYTVRRPLGDGPGYAVVDAVGDVHADGVADIGAFFFGFVGPGSAGPVQAVLDGRNGRVVQTKIALGAVDGAIDGRGVDMVMFTRSRNYSRVYAFQGSTGRELWVTTFAADPSWVTWGHLDGDRCLDLVISVEGSRDEIGGTVVLRGADGRPLWADWTTADGSRKLSGVVPGKDRNPGC